MNVRKVVVRVLLVVVGVPVVAVLAGAGWFYGEFYSLHRADGSFVTSGHRREYLLHVPRSYDGSRPVPLVVSLHGAMLWPATQMTLSGWNRVADHEGFIVVYPSGTSMSGGGTGVLPKVWPMGPGSLAADVRFIADLMDTLEATYRVDTTGSMSPGSRTAEEWPSRCRARFRDGSPRSGRWRRRRVCHGSGAGIRGRCR